MMARCSSGDSQVQVKYKKFSELDIGGCKICYIFNACCGTKTHSFGWPQRFNGPNFQTLKLFHRI